MPENPPFSQLIWSKTFSLDEIESIADEVAAFWPRYRVFALSGEMGAGKTTLCVALAKALGYSGHVSSPTFALVNTYTATSPEKPTILHFDLYRLGGEDAQNEEALIEEAYEAGLVELLATDALCLVEWPERAPSLLTPYAKDTLWISLSVSNPTDPIKRTLSVFASDLG